MDYSSGGNSQDNTKEQDDKCMSPLSNSSDSVSSITSMEEIVNNPEETDENGLGFKCPISSWISNIKLY